MKRLLFLLSLLAALTTSTLAQTKTDTLYFEFDIDPTETSHEFVYQFSDRVRACIEVEYYDGQNHSRFKAEEGEKRMTIYGKGYWRIYFTYELPFLSIWITSPISYGRSSDIDICEYGVYLSSLDISNTSTLYDLNCSNNQLISLDVTKNPELRSLWCSNNNLTSLDVSHNTALKYLLCTNNQLTTLDVSSCSALIDLDCGDNQLASLDVSHNLYLDRLHCYNNRLTSLDISHNSALTGLMCANNQLTTLDVSSCTDLGSLYCSDNPLTSLDVSHNTALYNLLCANNQLMTLDVSSCTDLVWLYCSDNPLTSLDVSHNSALTGLMCANNQLTTLDVSSCSALTGLDCQDNQLTTLDVSSCTDLVWLYCSDNQLTSLNVSGCSALTDLLCQINQLTTLDVSSCSTLTGLDCSINQLTTLDVSSNTALRAFWCAHNQIPLSTIYNIYSQTSNWSYFSAGAQTVRLTLPINQVLDLSSERMLGENLSDFELFPASYTEENFVFHFHKPIEYQLRLQNSIIPDINDHVIDNNIIAAFLYYISVELPDNYFTVQVESNNSQWGTATIAGDGFYLEENGFYDSVVTITATPEEGYRFVNWTKADGSVFSTEAVHTFIVTENLELTANFAVENFRVNLFANNPEWGYVFRTGNNYAYEDGDRLTILALPNEGFRFVNWSNGSNVFSKDALFTFAVTENMELTANFEEVGDVATESKKDNSFYVYAQDHKIHLSEYRGMVQVFNVTGQCVYSGHSTIIPVQQSGVYLVRVGASIYKVFVR